MLNFLQTTFIPAFILTEIRYYHEQKDIESFKNN